ncbi:MAG: MBL fold metallo-hydrolase, partial [Halanaeroarchaeum sp.]
THIHADHFSGVRELVDDETVGILPRAAIDRGVTYESSVDAIDDGASVSVGAATVTAIHTPGHTTGMTSYLVDDSVILTGDALFTESVARPDLEAGADGAADAARELYDSLREKILTLPDGVVVAGGHLSDAAVPSEDGTYTATIGELVETMAVLSLDESAFVDRILEDMPPRPSNFESIIATNLGREDVDADEAFQMELGPNNCATSTDALRGD